MTENFKKQDCEKIIAYLADKKQVLVDELIEKCGAEKLRIYPLLFELSQKKQRSNCLANLLSPLRKRRRG